MRTDPKELLALGMFSSGPRLGQRIELLLRRGGDVSSQVSASRVAVVTLALLAGTAAFSQAPLWIALAQPAEPPSFEVASVKPANPLDTGAALQIEPGGKLKLANVNARQIVQQAYQISDYRIYGGPAWLESERFNISAKAGDPNASLEQMRPMLQSLLKDRFQFASHREAKDLPMYRLVVARNGAKFVRSTSPDQEARMGMGQITDKKSTMNALASQLGQQLGRFVSDQTGLSDEFDFHLEWTPDAGEDRGGDDTPAPADPNRPSIFTALQEQLGLKLESAKGPVEVLVIDHAEKPDAN